MTDPLQKLLGSPARVKLLRLFLFNPRQSFTIADTIARCRVAHADARREVGLFLRIGLVLRSKRGAGVRYAVNGEFEYLTALQNLLLNAPLRGEDVAKRIRGIGSLKLVVLSGIFVGEWDGRLDVLVVGERIKERRLQGRMRTLESELGKELRYGVLGTDNFLYRLGMNDRLVRDVLDYPHKIVLDKLDIGLV